LIKRLARLYPLHIAVLFAYVAIWLACLVLEINPRDPGKYDIAALPQNLLLIHAWGTTPALSWNAPSWSISAEWAAYLLFPVLFYAASWERRRWLALAGFSALFLLAFWLFSGNRMLPISSDHDVLTDRIADYGVLRILFEFPLGVAAWNIYRTNRSQNASVMITIVSIGAAAVAMSTPMKGGEAVAVLCFPFILVGVATLERFRAVPVLSHPWVIYGGEISYSIYMVHALVRTCVTALVSIGHIHNPQLEEGLHLGAIGITVALSVATYKWIECPCRKWIARFAR
jgi:peptidoglycan/LPS O-acetylase OafA/YrhL